MCLYYFCNFKKHQIEEKQKGNLLKQGPPTLTLPNVLAITLPKTECGALCSCPLGHSLSQREKRAVCENSELPAACENLCWLVYPHHGCCPWRLLASAYWPLSTCRNCFKNSVNELMQGWVAMPCIQRWFFFFFLPVSIIFLFSVCCSYAAEFTFCGLESFSPEKDAAYGHRISLIFLTTYNFFLIIVPTFVAS